MRVSAYRSTFGCVLRETMAGVSNSVKIRFRRQTFFLAFLAPARAAPFRPLPL